MGFFNRDFRCFDNDSIDTAAMMESIFESTVDSGWSSGFGSGTDPWDNGSFPSADTSSWNNSDN